MSNISESDNETSEGHVIFVKNLNFDTNEDLLKTVTWDIFFYFWPSYLRQKIYHASNKILICFSTAFQ